jgi:hypothetical protein
LSIWISKLEDGKREGVLKLGEDSWELPELFKLFEHWLLNDSNDLSSNVQWIADIGFSPRAGANGGGPIISLDLMQSCIDKNISIYLSEYGDRD